MNNERGFSLLELLVISAIIASLAGIAISQFGSTKGKAFDRRALSSLRNVVGALESYYAENQSYATCNQDTCDTVLGVPGIISKGIELDVTAVNDNTDFTITAFHPAGTESYLWDTENGGLQ